MRVGRFVCLYDGKDCKETGELGKNLVGLVRKGWNKLVWFAPVVLLLVHSHPSCDESKVVERIGGRYQS